MEKIFNKIKTPLKLTALSLVASLFLFASADICGGKGFGFPMRFIYPFCAEGKFPISLVGLSVDFIYHFTLWFVILFLWEDLKETWRMFRRKPVK